MEGKTKKKPIWKRISFWLIIIFVIFPLATTVFTDDNEYETDENVDIAEKKADSAAIDYFSVAKKDSIAKAKAAENQAIIKELKNNFRTEKDEFEERSWVYHKTSAKYTNMNSVHLYFQLSDSGKPSNLRFRVQYEDDSWLFIKKMIFNIDGDNITFYPQQMERDCGNGGRIWEWCDDPASDTPLLVSKISNAKNVKVKMDGKQYYNTRKMSKTQLKAFKETLNYYIALGGNL